MPFTAIVLAGLVQAHVRAADAITVDPAEHNGVGASSHAFVLNRYDTFTVLGFSREGKFATFTVGCGDESGYVCYEAAIYDLQDDHVVERLWESSEDPLALIAFGSRLDEMLDRHAIEAPGAKLDAAFVAEQRFRVELVTSPMPRADGNDEVPRNTRVSLVRRVADTTSRKRIGLVRESGPLDGTVPKVLAVIASPFERRVAVLVVDGVYGGCGGGRDVVTVFGADLDERFEPITR